MKEQLAMHVEELQGIMGQVCAQVRAVSAAQDGST